MDLIELENAAWTYIFLPLFVLCGSILTVRTRAFPFRRLRLLRYDRADGEHGTGEGLASGQAASLSLAATIGTGNIIGTAQAIAMGGPGAIAWMWIAALFGMPIKFAEILLGQRYPGGATRYVRAALGALAGGAYAALGALSALSVGNMAQMNGTVSAICAAICLNDPCWRFLVGLILCVFLGTILAGGASRAGNAAELLVPTMTLVFACFSLRVILCHADRVPAAIREIWQSAMSPKSAFGAFHGIGMRQAMLWGLRRGAFSNEAGLGTASMVHSSVKAGDSAIHALWGVVEVFVDTLVVCTLTALTILCSGVSIRYGSLPGPELYRDALATVWGAPVASAVLAASLSLFSFTTVLASFVTGRHCFCALCGEQSDRSFLALYLFVAALGSIVPIGTVWRASDLIDLAIAVPALLSLLCLSREVGNCVLAHREEKNSDAVWLSCTDRGQDRRR